MTKSVFYLLTSSLNDLEIPPTYIFPSNYFLKELAFRVSIEGFRRIPTGRRIGRFAGRKAFKPAEHISPY